VSRYRDVQAVLNSSIASSDRLGVVRALRPDAEHPDVKALFDRLSLHFLFMDAPRHTRLRTLASKAFTPRRMEGMRAAIQRVVDDLLEPLLGGSEIELMKDFAVPLPVFVICEMLGIPEADRMRLKHWSEEYATFLGGVLLLPHEVVLRISRSMADFMEYFQELCRVRAERPGADLLSALLQAEQDGDALDRDSVCGTAMLLIMAGHETTTNLIGNGLLALLRQPEALQRLRELPELWPSALDELLRFDSPVQLVARRLLDDMLLDEQRLPAGAVVYLLIGSANRDPARYVEPERLDLARASNRHLSFGYGPHYCIGAALARIETQTALRSLLARATQLSAAGAELEWRANPTLRGLSCLRLQLR
jgi:cytochrome P450